MKVSNTGYKKDSKDKNEKSLIIPSGRITMSNVTHPVFAIDNLGNHAMMYPDQEFQFPGSNVQEFPIKEKGGTMKKPDNKGFKSLPKKVQDMILDNMTKQFGGENLARPIWTMQTGGAVNDDVYSAAGYIPADNPYLQKGGQNKFTPEQWNKFNMDQGLKASPGYSNAAVNMNKSYLEFYDPNKFQPVPGDAGSIGWNKIGDPSYKYTSEQNSPFIKYTPPPQQTQLIPQKTYIENDPNRKPYQFGPNQNFDPNTGNYFTGPVPLADNSNIIKPLTREMGGPLKKFVSNYEKQFGGAHGNEKLQGQSIDEFLQKRNTDFVDYLANNTKNFMYKDEAKNFMQMGGPFGQPTVDVPNYVQGMTDQYNYPMQQFPQSNPYQFGMPQNGIDPNQVSFNNDMQNRLNETAPKQNMFSNSNKADLGMMGAQTINNFANKYQNYQKQQKLNQQQAISNTSPAFYGNQGQYDINQGNIRPNQTTPSYKKGGQYSMSQKQVNDLVSQGYDIEFLD